MKLQEIIKRTLQDHCEACGSTKNLIRTRIPLTEHIIYVCKECKYEKKEA